MNILVRGINLKISEIFADHAEARVRAALKHLGRHVESVEIRVGDINGPRGGIDLNARVIAALRQGGSIIAEVAAADGYAAVDRAVAKVAARTQRHIRRIRKEQLASHDEPQTYSRSRRYQPAT